MDCANPIFTRRCVKSQNGKSDGSNSSRSSFARRQPDLPAVLHLPIASARIIIWSRVARRSWPRRWKTRCDNC